MPNGIGQQYLRQIASLVGATGLAHSVILLCSPLISRLYLPLDLGRFGLFTSVVVCVATLASMRYEAAIIAAESDDHAADLALGAMLLGVVSSLLAGIVLLLLVNKGILGFGTLGTKAIPIALVSISLASWTSVLRSILIRAEGYNSIAQSLLVRNVTIVGFQVLLGVVGFSWSGLLVADVLGKLAAFGWLLRARPPLAIFSLNAGRFRKLMATLKRYYKFPLYGLPSTISDSVSPALALPMVTQLYGVALAGQFALAQSAMVLPSALLGGAVADVFHKQLATLKNKEPKLAQRLFYKTAIGLFVTALVPAIAIVLGREWLFLKVFGPNWGLAGRIAVLMIPWMILSLSVSPVSRVIFVVEGQRFKLVYDFLLLVGVLVSFYVCHAMNLEPLHGIALISLAYALPYIFYYLILSYLVKSEVNKA